ncbi:MAG: hypothetical protein AB7S74_03190 [Hyphomicrobium sp.]
MKMFSIATMALFAFAMAMTSFHSEALAGKHTGRNVAIGVAAGLATMAIISGAARANDRARQGRNYCARLMDKCDDGQEWACDKYEDRCED